MEKNGSFAGRLLSLDVFRGITIAGMILVNCPGSDQIYAAFRHAEWDGCTFADLVFPSFLVIMGVSLAISLGRRLDRGRSPQILMSQATARAAAIFAFGLATSLFIYHPGMGFRFMGVLQRIALCYFICAALFLWTDFRAQAALAGLGLAAYWLLMTKVPVPGVGAGILSREGNLASYLDRLLMQGHLYHPKSDPEGLLSTIPAVSTSLLGVLAGHWLRARQRNARKVAGLMAAGLICLEAGRLWGVRFPINKEIWTSSYALFAGGWALCGLALCYWVIEIGKFKAWTPPFKIFGRNPLLCYFLSALFYGVQEFIKMPVRGAPGNLKLWFCAVLFETWLPRPGAALAYGLCYTVLFMVLMGSLYRRKIFLRV